MTSALIGMTLAARPASGGESVTGEAGRDATASGAVGPDASGADEAVERQGTATIWGGFVSFLAVGCPVCNQAAVALVGVSGALSWWAPVQPVLGIAAVGLLGWTLRRRLRTCRATACPIPS